MREPEEELNNEKLIINLPQILETFTVMNSIVQDDVNFLQVINSMLDCVLDLIISNGEIDVSQRIENMTSEVFLTAKYKGVPFNLEKSQCNEMFREAIYCLMDEVMIKSDSIHPAVYNYIVETIINNKIVIVIRKK